MPPIDNSLSTGTRTGLNAAKLVRMSNEIAAFFRPYPEEEAVAGIREHIAAFWTPRMRDTLAGLDGGERQALDPRVFLALHGVQQGESPVEKAVAGPEGVGQLASDAG